MATPAARKASSASSELTIKAPSTNSGSQRVGWTSSVRPCPSSLPDYYKLTNAKDEAKVAAKKEELVNDLVNAFRAALKPVLEQRKAEQEAERQNRIELAKSRIAELRAAIETRIPNGGFHGDATNGGHPEAITPWEQNPPFEGASKVIQIATARNVIYRVIAARYGEQEHNNTRNLVGKIHCRSG